MKILVTGLSGFTGHYLKTELENHGYTVFGLESNLLDLDSLTVDVTHLNPNAVIHLAGIAFVGHGNPNDFYHVNLLGTRNLLTAIQHCKKQVEFVLLASSANVYGNADAEVISEDTRTQPANDYAVSKLSMEIMTNLWKDQLPITIVRPFNYTGKGQSLSFLLPKITHHFKSKKKVIELGNLEVARDFSDVRVVANIYRRLLETPAAIGQTFNVCSGKAHTLNEIIKMAEKITDQTIEVCVNPAFVRSNEVKRLVGSRAKLEATIGPIEDIPIHETLRWMLEEDKG